MVCELLAATEPCVAKCTSGGDSMTGNCARWPGLGVAATLTAGVAVVVLLLMVSVLAFVAAECNDARVPQAEHAVSMHMVRFKSRLPSSNCMYHSIIDNDSPFSIFLHS